MTANGNDTRFSGICEKYLRYKSNEHSVTQLPVSHSISIDRPAARTISVSFPDLLCEEKISLTPAQNMPFTEESESNSLKSPKFILSSSIQFALTWRPLDLDFDLSDSDLSGEYLARDFDDDCLSRQLLA
jgi:hypothetical protein